MILLGLDAELRLERVVDLAPRVANLEDDLGDRGLADDAERPAIVGGDRAFALRVAAPARRRRLAELERREVNRRVKILRREGLDADGRARDRAARVVDQLPRIENPSGSDEAATWSSAVPRT